LLSDAPWYVGEGKYPIAAYSEFMPPPRLGRKPCGRIDSLLFSEDEPWGWHVTEYEEAFELQPGLRHLAAKLVSALHHLGHGEPAHGISRNKLADNPYWPKELQESGARGQERYVVLLPLALSRTQDDKGRVFIENYDINRKGYHDTHDTLENIDLDYGAAVAAIAIESVARAATEEPPWGDSS